MAERTTEEEMQSIIKLALKPMRTDLSSANKKASLGKLVSTPKPKTDVVKKVSGFKTDTFLDTLFLNNGEQINGIPKVIQIGITGLPSSGKSILVEEIAVKLTERGVKTLLTTSEDSWRTDNERIDLESRLQQKAELLELDWDKITKNLFVLDTVSHSELREWNTLAEAYRFVCESEKVKFVFVDSVTLLDSYRGALKARLRELTTYNQLHGITAIFVNQRATEDFDKRGMAGGIGLGHILDSTVIVDYGVPSSWKRQMKQDFKDLGIEVKQGDSHRFARVLGCRLCGYDGKYKPITITKNGFLRLLEGEKKE